MRKFNLKTKFLRFTNVIVIASLVVSGFSLGKMAHADTICTPVVTSSTGLGITNFTADSINNTTPTPSGQGGVTYKDYTNIIAPELVTKGDNIDFNITYDPSVPTYTAFNWWFDNGRVESLGVLPAFVGYTSVHSSILNYLPTGLATFRANISTTNTATLCASDDGEFEDYSFIIQGTTPAVNVMTNNTTTFVREGGRTDTLELQLDTQPTSNVTINLTPDSRFTLSSSSITFTPANWYVHRVITVTAVDDGTANGQENQQLSFAAVSSDLDYSGLVVAPLNVQVVDNDSVDDSSVDIHILSTSTANTDGTDLSKVSGITGFDEFGGNNLFGPTGLISEDVSTPIARRYSYTNGLTSPLIASIQPELTTLTSPTVLSLGDDELSSDITLPFDVMLYGMAMGHIKIGSNGIIYLSPTDVQSNNLGNGEPWNLDGTGMDMTQMTSVSLYSQDNNFSPNGEVMIAALWSDLITADAGGSGTISYGVEGTAPNRVFIIYYDGVTPIDGTGGVNTVQVKLHESAINPSGDVVVSANVEPSISYTLDTSNCSFGDLTSATVKTCVINVTVATNATSGYTAFIRDVNNGTLISGTDNINAVIGTSLNAGTEGFGVSTSVGSQNLIQEPDCSAAALPINVEVVTTSNQTFSSADAPVPGDEIALCMAASITDTTAAGSYSDTAYITVVGNF